ncbi:response regulator [Gemmatimonadota bacterium]
MSETQPTAVHPTSVPPVEDVLDKFPVGIGFIDASSQLIFRNRRFRELLPSRDDAPDDPDVQPPLSDLPCFEDPDILAEFLDSLRIGKAQDIRWTQPGEQGGAKESILRIRGLPFEQSPNGGVLASVLIEDITDSERLRRHLNQAQRMESIGSLASAVAHDFNNILTAILSSVHLMKMTTDQNGDLAMPLNTIEKTALSAGQLAEQLLTLSRNRSVAPRELSVNVSILDARSLLERVLKEDIQLELDLAEQEWCVVADQSQILHTLVNLCLNAQDALGGRGIITIATRNVDRTGGRTVEGDLKPGHYVIISVTDAGTGIPREIMDRVFDPFFTTKESGTGLGLATAYSFAREQGGTVTIYSEVGKGTTVNVYLRARPHGPESDPAGSTSDASLYDGEETILLVDDEPLLLDLGREILALHGYSVLTAPSGEDALRVHDDNPARIPLVILDMAMPGMSGLETIRALRKRDPSIRVILSSGLHPSDRMADLLGSDVDAFVNKPYEVDRLAREVRRLLDTPGPPVA